MDLKTMMASGVFFEFRDARGNSVGQAVYFDWSGRPVPGIGDDVCCRLGGGSAHKLRGRVRSRFFDLQQQDDGEPCVWVRLVVDVTLAKSQAQRLTRMRSTPPRFSDN